MEHIANLDYIKYIERINRVTDFVGLKLSTIHAFSDYDVMQFKGSIDRTIEHRNDFWDQYDLKFILSLAEVIRENMGEDESDFIRIVICIKAIIHIPEDFETVGKAMDLLDLIERYEVVGYDE